MRSMPVRRRRTEATSLPAANQPSAEDPGRAPTSNLLDCLNNDHGNACRLIALYGEDLRYCHPFKKWLIWDGQRWALDQTGQAQQLAKLAMLEFLKQSVQANARDFEKFARASLDARRIASMLWMAQSDIKIRPSTAGYSP